MKYFWETPFSSSQFLQGSKFSRMDPGLLWALFHPCCWLAASSLYIHYDCAPPKCHKPLTKAGRAQLTLLSVEAALAGVLWGKTGLTVLATVLQMKWASTCWDICVSTLTDKSWEHFTTRSFWVWNGVVGQGVGEGTWWTWCLVLDAHLVVSIWPHSDHSSWRSHSPQDVIAVGAFQIVSVAVIALEVLQYQSPGTAKDFALFV